jgi:hypothetical protein
MSGAGERHKLKPGDLHFAYLDRPSKCPVCGKHYAATYRSKDKTIYRHPGIKGTFSSRRKMTSSTYCEKLHK